MVLLAGTGHSLIQSKDTVYDLLVEWISARLAGEPMTPGV
jgi:hypothetical protein